MSFDEDETDRERVAFACLAGEVEGSEEDLDAGKIWSAVAGDLSAEETGQLLDRAAESAAIAEAWSLARELQTARALYTSGIPVEPYRRWGGRATFWAGIAATLLLAVGLWPGLWKGETSQPPVYRATDGQSLDSEIEEDVDLARESFLLRWSPAGGEGWRYEVRVSTTDLEELARARDLADPEYLVPSAALEACETGSRLYWRVEARHGDGRRMASSTFIVGLR